MRRYLSVRCRIRKQPAQNFENLTIQDTFKVEKHGWKLTLIYSPMFIKVLAIVKALSVRMAMINTFRHLLKFPVMESFETAAISGLVPASVPPG